MSIEFDRPESDFDLIEVTRTDDDGNETTSIEQTLTAAGKLLLGDPDKNYDSARSWSTIMGDNNDKDYMIDIDGNQVSLTSVQDMSFYEALAVENSGINDWGWRFAEADKAGRDVVPVARVYAGRAVGFHDLRDYDDDDIGFRPAVKIA